MIRQVTPGQGPKPSKARFAFTLRAAFVVLTLVALWLGWQANTIRQRKRAMAFLRKGGAEVFTGTLMGGDIQYLRKSDGTSPGALRIWLGDTDVWQVHFNRTLGSKGFEELTAEERRCVDALPEAAVTSY